MVIGFESAEIAKATGSALFVKIARSEAKATL